MPGTKNAWMWNAQDFSEGNIVHEKLAVKFKYEAQWKEFKELLELAKSIASGAVDFKDDKFDRVTVDAAETVVPIAESGKKAVEEMAVNNPFAAASPSRGPIVEEPPTNSSTDSGRASK